MKPPLAEGKLPTDVLERLLRHTSRSPLLAVGAAPGEDAAVAPGAPTIVITADPITFTDERHRRVCRRRECERHRGHGGQPVYLTTTILLAPGATEDQLERIFSDIADACGKAGILWVGGHTEVTPVVTRTVVCGQAVGFLSREPLQTGGRSRATASACRNGWGWRGRQPSRGRSPPSAGGSWVRSGSPRCWAGWMTRGSRSWRRGKRWRDSLSLRGTTPRKAAWPWASRKSAAGAARARSSTTSPLPIREETRLLCGLFGMDPLGLLSSGVFLFTAARPVARPCLRRARRAGHPGGRHRNDHRSGDGSVA